MGFNGVGQHYDSIEVEKGEAAAYKLDETQIPEAIEAQQNVSKTRSRRRHSGLIAGFLILVCLLAPSKIYKAISDTSFGENVFWIRGILL